MNISLKILGTASAMPISSRNPSAQVLSVHGRLFLIDCGEGTQKVFRKEHLSFVKIEAIFISHIHGDHVFGIFGFLSTMALFGRTQELHIYAPQAFGGILKFFLSYFGEGIGFDIIHHPLAMKGIEEVHLSKHVKVSSFPLQHKIDCYGFRFDEIVSSRRDGTVPQAHSYAYCSDTAYFPELSSWVKGVDLLYHESTYIEEFRQKASMYHHSTASEAATVARDAGVGKLILGHYSSRVRDVSVFEEEARKVFSESYASNEGDSFEL